MRKLLLSITLTLAFTGLTALAATGFVPIAPIVDYKGQTVTSATSLQEYINIVFNFALAAGAVLAVIMIGIGGFEYMLSQTMTGQKDGRGRITQALYGLAILILVYLILYVINPDIISLNIFGA